MPQVLIPPPHMISGGGSGGEQSLVLPFFYVQQLCVDAIFPQQQQCQWMHDTNKRFVNVGFAFGLVYLFDCLQYQQPAPCVAPFPHSRLPGCFLFR